MSRTAPIRWVSSQVQRLTKTVRSYNARLTNIEREYGVDLSYLRANVSDLKSKIKTSSELNQEIADMRQVFKKYNKNATNIRSDGRFQFEQKIEQRKRNRARRKAQATYKNVVGEAKTPQEIAYKITDTDAIADIERMSYEQLTDYLYDDKLSKYIDNYKKAMENDNFEFKEDVERIIQAFMEQDPDALGQIFAMPDAERQIDYIYKKSADMTPYESRSVRIMSYWNEKATQYGIEVR